MDYRKGAKSRLRLSARRKKGNNITKYHRFRREGLPSPNNKGLSSGTTHVEIDEQQYMGNVEVNDLILEQDTSTDNRNDSDYIEIIEPIIVEGFRLINVPQFLNQLVELESHNSLMGCRLYNLKIIKEKKCGFKSTFTIRCNMCGFLGLVSTCSEQYLDINTAAVTGIINTGGGYTQLKNISSAMAIPSMSFNLYKKIHSQVCNAWESVAMQSMEDAAAEEAQLAINSNSVDNNGIPLITVVCDGSWAKRSYRGGGNYNSLSGAAAIVGFKTGKILYLGVKNKYCCICQRAANKNEVPSEHTCYKNWNGSSTSMEANIIAEGFCKSVSMHNIIYHKMIADGDSSCYKKIIDSRPYQNCTVQKIECRNHLLRNYCNKLRECTKTKGVPGSVKNLISKNILRARSAVVKAIHYRRNQMAATEEDKIKNLRKDILNSISHIFGEHENCFELGYFCQKKEPDPENRMLDIKLFGLEEKIMNAVRYLGSHSRSLLENVDNNVVEQFNAMIAQKVGGKRINYTMRRCYQARCFAAVVAKNTRQPLSAIHKYLQGGKDPNPYISKLEQKSINIKKKKKKILPTIKKPSYSDMDYGENCKKPDLDVDAYEHLKKNFLDMLNKKEDEYKELEKRTRLQTDCNEWKQTRRKLVTSSNFGKICKMRPATSCVSTVRSILYGEFFSKATTWGRENEERAKGLLQQKYRFQIRNCGIVINKNWPYMGASPDGIILSQGPQETQCLLEIKCPYSARNMTVKEAVDEGVIKYLKIIKESYILNQNHDYYYQIQGQLNICSAAKCYFAVWTPRDLVVLDVEKNTDFFEKTMLPKLHQFYFDCLLPEILDPRHTRGMTIRDPHYILEAQKNKNKKGDCSGYG